MLTRRGLIAGVSASLLLPSRKLFAAPSTISQVCCRPSLPSQFSVPNGLVGYWGFDPDCLDFTQGKAFDLSINGTVGSLIGSPPLAAGQVGTALSFNGSSQYVSLGTPSLIPAATDLSISAWVFKTGTTDGSILAQRNGFSVGANQFTLGTGNAANQVSFSTGGSTSNFSGSVIPTNVWTHVAYTGNSAGRNAWINGVSTSSATFSGQTGSGSGNNLAIGFLATEGVNHWAGTIDDVCLWNRFLAPWEILAKYQAGLQGSRNAPVNLSLPPN